MNSSNYGNGLDQWNIDQIKSKNWFYRLAERGVITRDEAMREANHWTNLRPMWARANFREGDPTRKTYAQLDLF